MALGRTPEVVDTSKEGIGVDEKIDSPPQYGGGALGSDLEKGQPRDRKMSRIGGPIPGTMGESDADSTISVGKQLELEQGNAIKYRTCSWQKVRNGPINLSCTYFRCPSKE